MEEKEIYKVWKKTYNRRYGYITWEVSDQGNVKKNGAQYECRTNKNGYKVLGCGSTLHRAVATLFIPNPDNKPYIDHINTIKIDNRAVNLRWVTTKENANNPLTRKHNSEAKKGKPRSEETKRKQSKSMKGKSPSNKGKHKVWDNKELNKFHYE